MPYAHHASTKHCCCSHRRIRSARSSPCHRPKGPRLTRTPERTAILWEHSPCEACAAAVSACPSLRVRR